MRAFILGSLGALSVAGSHASAQIINDRFPGPLIVVRTSDSQGSSELYTLDTPYVLTPFDQTLSLPANRTVRLVLSLPANVERYAVAGQNGVLAEWTNSYAIEVTHTGAVSVGIAGLLKGTQISVSLNPPVNQTMQSTVSGEDLSDTLSFAGGGAVASASGQVHQIPGSFSASGSSSVMLQRSTTIESFPVGAAVSANTSCTCEYVAGPAGATLRLRGFVNMMVRQVNPPPGPPPPAGGDQSNPRMPGNGGRFSGSQSGAWFDPPTAYGFRFTAAEPGLFTQIADFPTGFTRPLQVLVGGHDLGLYGPGQSVVFSDNAGVLGELLIGGTGVREFEVRGIHPMLDPASPLAFPIKLATDSDDMTFTMSPIELATPCGYDLDCGGTADRADLCAWLSAPIDLDGDGVVSDADSAGLLAYLGFGLAAVGDSDGDGIPNACECTIIDLDDSFGPSVPDIFIYLSRWFAADPRADLDGNGVGVPDIFTFLGLWFAGC